MRQRTKRFVFLLEQVLIISLATGAVHAELVGHWKLDETTGSRAADAAARGHDGVLLGGLSFDGNSVEGVIGKGLCFDGDDDRLYIEALSVPTGTFTIALWFKPDFDLRGDVGRTYMTFWGGPARPQGDKPYFVIGKAEGARMRLYISVGETQQYVDSITDSWSASKWYHAAAVYDRGYAKLYINGVLEGSAVHAGSHYGSSGFYVGGRRDLGSSFEGNLDDIRIYDEALSEALIRDLAGLDPAPQSLATAFTKARELMAEEPQRAIALIESKLAQLQQWREQIPDRYVPRCEELSFDLHFLLAKAKERAGVDKQAVEAAYKHAFEQGSPSLSASTSVLLYLLEDGRTKGFETVVGALNRDHKRFPGKVVETAEQMINHSRPQETIRLLQAVLDTGVSKGSSGAPAERSKLPQLYFQLAKAKEAAGADPKEVADAYARTFGASQHGCVRERTAGLIWLLENDQRQEYDQILGRFTRSGGAKTSAKIAAEICRHFESKKDWPGFEGFLDALLGETEDSFGWALFVESRITDKTSPWTKAYIRYLDEKPRVKFGWDWTAERYVAARKFHKAIDLYRDIIEHCPNEQHKRMLRLRLCRCLFLAGQYGEVVKTVDGLTGDSTTGDDKRTGEAMLMKGRAYTHLGEPQKATEIFSVVIKNRPATDQAAEAAFYLGYCYVLQEQRGKATELLNEVVSKYPKSSYASKAGLCLARIADATE